jgi:DNA-directed RNA polymerase III subunit RPC7
VVLDPKRGKKSKLYRESMQYRHQNTHYFIIEQKTRTIQDEYGQLEALLNAEDKDGDEDEEGEDGEKKEGDEDAEDEEEYEDEEELVDDNDYGQNYFDNGEGDDIDDDDGEDTYS